MNIRNLRNQQGLSIIGFIIVLSLVVFTSFIAMRIWPIYYEYFAVVNAMNSVASTRGSARMSPYDVRAKVYANLFVSGTEGTIKNENITVVRKNGVHVRIVYERREPLIGNLDVIAHFDKMVRLQN